MNLEAKSKKLSKTRGIAAMNPQDFDRWMDSYFKGKTAQDLRRILVVENPRLAHFFRLNPLPKHSKRCYTQMRKK